MTYTATIGVTSPGAGNPGGTVALSDNGSTITGCGSVNLVSGTAACQVTYTAAGGHPITATYSGDGNFWGSNDSLSQQAKAPATTQLKSSANPSVYGQAVTFTATVSSSASGTPSGTVQFKIDGTNVGGAVNVNASSQATYTTSTAAVASHSVTAAYSGDGAFIGGTSAVLTQYVDTNLSGYPKLSSGAYNLQNATLSGAYLVQANLAGANASQATFSNASLMGVNLSNANLSQANLTGANLSNANLTGATLTQTNLKGANLTGATLTKVTWKSTTCPDGTNSNLDGGSCSGHF